MISDEAKKDPATYNKWYASFQNFIKEGTQVDTDNKQALFQLLRFHANYGSQHDFISLDDYIAKMKPDQKKIYFAFGSSYTHAMQSPFYEPFLGKDVPVLVVTNQLDEFCLSSTGEYKGHSFVNIEQAEVDEMRKDLGLAKDSIDV